MIFAATEKGEQTMIEPIKLKPCKCGGTPKLHTKSNRFYFECNGECWTQSNKFGSIYEAILDWNKQVSEEDDI